VLYAHAEAELPPFTGVSAFTSWEPFQLLTIGLLAAAGLYVWGVVRLARRGVAWPLHRTAVFLVGGIGTIAFVTVGGIGAYDDELLSDHMIQHMVLGMLAPIFLALGAPVTLALRTLPARPRGWLVSALHSRVAKVVAFPLVSFGLYIATPFVLYFSSLYPLTLEHEWLHNLMHLHFILIGCLFFWPLIGIDPLPGRWPYPARALLMILSTPFHAVLGLTIMQSATLIAGDYYPNLHLAWSNPASDQRVAGGILWAGGEVIAVVMLAALVGQWMRSSDREARRVDRRLDLEEARAARAAAAVASADRTDDGDDERRSADLERERERAWSATTGIPMMDDPAAASAPAPTSAPAQAQPARPSGQPSGETTPPRSNQTPSAGVGR
jgi:putative copper resistance protein D